MHIVAVDLGKRVSGLAVFRRSGELVRAMEVRCASATPDGMASVLVGAALGLGVALPDSRWHVEKMLDYSGKGRRREDLQHLRDITVSLVDDHSLRVTEHAAHRWKGGITKRVTRLRVWGRREALPRQPGLLTPSERLRVDPVSKETIDAIGLGLFVLGRARRGMLPP